MIDYVYHESPPYLLVFSGFTYYHIITAHRISLDIWKPNNHPILLQKTLRRRQNDRQTQGSLLKTFTEAVPRFSTSTHSGSLPRRILGGGLGYPKKTILKPSLNLPSINFLSTKPWNFADKGKHTIHVEYQILCDVY